MGKTRPPYPEEFRREAVALVRSDDRSIPAIARWLGVSDQTLRNWVRQADVSISRREGLSSDEPEALRHLRERVRDPGAGEGVPGNSDRLLRQGER